MSRVLLALGTAFWLVPYQDGTRSQVSPCDDLGGMLDAVPHVALRRTAGPIDPLWVGEPPAVCQIVLETNDSLLAGAPVQAFDAEPGTDVYRAGWRTLPEISADGAGTSIHGIARGGSRCVVQFEQPAYIDDDGTFVQSDTLTITIQCSGQP